MRVEVTEIEIALFWKSQGILFGRLCWLRSTCSGAGICWPRRQIWSFLRVQEFFNTKIQPRKYTGCDTNLKIYIYNYVFALAPAQVGADPRHYILLHHVFGGERRKRAEESLLSKTSKQSPAAHVRQQYVL